MNRELTACEQDVFNVLVSKAFLANYAILHKNFHCDMEGAKSFFEELIFIVNTTLKVVALANEVHSGRNKSMLVLLSFRCNFGKSSHFLSQSVEKDAAASQSQNQVESRFLLDVKRAKSAAVVKLFTSKDNSLFVWWNTLFIHDFPFHLFYGVGRFNIKRYCPPSQSLNVDLHVCSVRKFIN